MIMREKSGEKFDGDLHKRHSLTYTPSKVLACCVPAQKVGTKEGNGGKKKKKPFSSKFSIKF
jgi:hypothetical protein